ncbi:MAG: low molecular weight protein-tyrosine-phosphatase [Bdellovibrionota bacterium]|nr:low molecular weight protein-tyrosine-phosphatase [Bdellovibrionota bacterium]
MEKTSVLFVCLGNICRSPTAEGIFHRLIKERGLSNYFEVDSCGTSAYHAGNPPDKRSQQEAEKRGTDLSFIRSRQFITEDYYRFQYIFPMDERNQSDIIDDYPENSEAKVQLLLEYNPQVKEKSVPDPYWGGARGFAHVYDIIEESLTYFLDQWQKSQT